MRNRASTWRRCRAFSEQWNSTPAMNSTISTSGWSIFRTSRSVQRRKCIGSATRKFPHSSRQYLGLAFSHYAVREYAEAADAFTTALEIDPESPAVFQAWKTVLSFLAPKDWEALLPRLDRLAAAHPQNAELAFAYGAALFRLGVSKGQEGAFDRPQALLEKSVRLRPDFPEAHLELGALVRSAKSRIRRRSTNTLKSSARIPSQTSRTIGWARSIGT